MFIIDIINHMTEFLHPERSMSQASATVLQTAASLIPTLVEEHPEIVDLYRAGIPQAEIAQIVIPEAQEFPSAGRVAVGNALGKLLPPEVRVEITHQVRSKRSRDHIRAMPEDEFKAHQREAARQRHLKHGVDYEAMARGKGLVPYTEVERNFAYFLSTQSDYQYPSGNNKGKVILNKIAGALNEIFHPEAGVRDRNSVRGLLNDWRKKNREAQK